MIKTIVVALLVLVSFSACFLSVKDIQIEHVPDQSTTLPEKGGD